MRWLLAVMVLALPAAAAAERWQAAGTVSGVVVTEEGRPLPRAAVAVTGTTIGAHTDADGRFLISGVPAGTRVLRATARGYREALRRVEVVPDDTALAGFMLGPDAMRGSRLWLIDPARAQVD